MVRICGELVWKEWEKYRSGNGGVTLMPLCRRVVGRRDLFCYGGGDSERIWF